LLSAIISYCITPSTVQEEKSSYVVLRNSQ